MATEDTGWDQEDSASWLQYNKEKLEKTGKAQWSVGEVIRPAGPTVEKLAAGVYLPGINQDGVFLKPMNVVSDELVALPDTAGSELLEAMAVFWASEEKFRSIKQLYKRGVLLYGPSGSGKTSILKQMMGQLVQDDGVVVIFNNPASTLAGLQVIRGIEPTRRIVVVLEDIEELIKEHGEHEILSLLDGESSIDNCVYLASTNYAEDLDKRIVNRPSRFDRVVHIGMPDAAARRVYLEAVVPTGTLVKEGSETNVGTQIKAGEVLDRWVRDTEGLGVAHLRELVVAIVCLGENYDEALTRIKEMGKLKSDSKVIPGLGQRNGNVSRGSKKRAVGPDPDEWPDEA